MGKITLTFDIGESYIKIAKNEKGKIKLFRQQIPANMVKEGVIQTPVLVKDFLRELRKQYNLPKCECGLVVSDDISICRTLTLPIMSEEQLQVNLPFEFADYITGKASHYIYDYALHEILNDDEGKPAEMLLTGVVMSKETINTYVDIFRDAGFKLRRIVPNEACLMNIMRAAVKEGRAKKDQEYCIVNLGHRTTQVYIFKGDVLQVFRKIYIGGSAMDKAISEHEMVDEYVSRVYKHKNYNNVLYTDYSRELYRSLAVEIMKAINFYRYNNRDSELTEMYFAGGGSNIGDLCMDVAEACDLKSKSIVNLMPNNLAMDTDMSGVFAIGAMMQ